MLSQKSLINRAIRFRELRKMQMHLKSLARTRYARQIFKKKIGNDFAIERIFHHAAEFLECSFSNELNSDLEVIKAKIRVVRALRLMAYACEKSGKANKKIPLVNIRIFRSAVTNLYRITKRKKVFWECDEQWLQLGLCAHATFS